MISMESKVANFVSHTFHSWLRSSCYVNCDTGMIGRFFGVVEQINHVVKK